MDKNEKLAIARKKLKKFQARNSPQTKKGGGDASALNTRGSQKKAKSSAPATSSSSTGTPSTVHEHISPPQPKNARLSSVEGLREISQEISSLLSESSLKQTSTPIKPAAQLTPPPTTVSSSLRSSLNALAPPTTTQLSPSVAAAPIHTPSLGTSAASSMSDLAIGNHLNDLPFMFKSGSASSLGSSSVPFGQSLYGRQQSTEQHALKENGYPLLTPSTVVESLQQNKVSNPSSSLLPNFGHQEGEETKINSTPRLVTYNVNLSLNGRDTHGHAPSKDVMSERGPPVDFQIGTPQHQHSPSSEREVPTHLHDGYTESHKRASLDGPPQHSSMSDEQRRELERKVQAHAQTIDILVSEKSKLQAELTRLRTQLESRMREWEDGQSHLKCTRQSLEELEHSKQLLNEELSHKQRALSQNEMECSKLRENVEKLRGLLEDQQEENTELISKITAQSAEVSSVKNANVELESRLAMSELLVQQLSGDSASQTTPTRVDPTLEEELTKVRGEVAQLKSRLQQVTSERDQVNSDLSALRDAMVQQQEENTSKLADAQTKLAESSVQVTCLTEELQTLTREKEALSEKVTTEHAQFEQSNRVATETLQQERDELQGHVQQCLQENQQLTKENSELREQSLELEVELSRLKEQSIDHQSLLTTIAQDKETLSRAMSQNKELKTNMAELQDAFVRLSNQNMELASELETERHHVAQFKSALATGEREQPSLLPLPPPPPPASEVSMTESGSATPTVVQATPTGAAVIEDDVEGRSDLVDVRTQELSRFKEQQEQIELLTSERSHLLAQLQSLESEHNRSIEEHHRAQQQLAELSQQHQQLLQEVREEEERRKEVKKQDEIDFSTMSEDPVDVTQLSKEQLLQLQSNFRALQWKFVSLMSEKAELLERLQEHEHVIVQLSVETETIGEYISLYQSQRESLKAKFMEKDLFIEQLTNEKATIQQKLHQLQVLMRQLLSERAGRMMNGHQILSVRPTSLSTSAFSLNPSPPHSPTDIPIHMRPVSSPGKGHLGVEEHEISSSFSFSRLTVENNENEEDNSLDFVDGGETEHEGQRPSLSVQSERVMKKHRSREDKRIEDDSHMTSVTAEQIMQLIDQLEITTSGLDQHIAPCACCTGQLTVV